MVGSDVRFWSAAGADQVREELLGVVQDPYAVRHYSARAWVYRFGSGPGRGGDADLDLQAGRSQDPDLGEVRAHCCRRTTATAPNASSQSSCSTYRSGTSVSTIRSTSDVIRAASRAHELTIATPRASGCPSAHRTALSATSSTSCHRTAGLAT